MGGVKQYEEWISKKNLKKQKVKHATFQNGDLRGLEYIGDDDLNKRNEIVASLARKYVISSSYPESGDWDLNLAKILCRECMLGEESDIYGLVFF